MATHDTNYVMVGNVFSQRSQDLTVVKINHHTFLDSGCQILAVSHSFMDPFINFSIIVLKLVNIVKICASGVKWKIKFWLDDHSTLFDQLILSQTFRKVNPSNDVHSTEIFITQAAFILCRKIQINQTHVSFKQWPTSKRLFITFLTKRSQEISSICEHFGSIRGYLVDSCIEWRLFDLFVTQFLHECLQHPLDRAIVVIYPCARRRYRGGWVS